MATPLNIKTTWQDRLGDRWATIKPLALALIIGLVAGPLISGMMGWQVLRGTSEQRIHASAVEQQSMICVANARATTPDTASMNWAARRELAEKYAVMPGRTTADADVITACNQGLAAS